MDLDIIQSTKEGEITQFLCDARDYFKASLATSEYENTSNMFYLTAAETTEQLLNRCELLLNRLSNKNYQSSILNTATTAAATTIDNGSPQLVTNGLENHQRRRQEQQQQIKDSSNVVDIKLHHHPPHHQHITTVNGSTAAQPDQQLKKQHEDVSYLDMSAAHNNNKKRPSSREFTDHMNTSADSDKTFRCSTLIVKQNKSFLHRLHDTMTTTTDEEAEDDEENENLDDHIDNFEDDPQIYDICQVTTQGSDGEEDNVGHEETQKAITPDSHFSLPHIGCPYMDLPAGHLSIQKSTKYGQLQRIEKRLFFDQSKKCYCGILNDWLLCYAEGPTSSRPTITLYLKMPGIEIEHFGEGKRRDVCFQVTTCDPNRRFVFQAVNEIDAKEWIHAIEAAIRSDISGVMRNSSTRKLPTPPVMKKITFLSSFQRNNDPPKHNEMSTSLTSNDCIYEEPSPIYHAQDISIAPPQLPNKENSHLALADKFEYDIPKCPAQPFKSQGKDNDTNLINPYADAKDSSKLDEANASLETKPSNFNTSTQRLNLKMEEKLDFQAKVKDVHSKLTNQLTNGPNPKKTLKKSISSSSSSHTDEETLVCNTPPPSSPSTAEMKKQKKSTTPQSSPQKLSSTEKISSTSSTKNWFLNRLNKTTSSTRSNSSSPSNSPAKCKQSEKENLLNSSDTCDGYDIHDSHLSSNPASPILKSSTPATAKSKVNMIINQLEASGHLATMFSVDAVSSFSSICDNDCNNYEPIVTVSTPPSSFMKKV